MDAMLLQRVSVQASQDINTFVIRETAALRGLRKELIICLAVRKLTRSWAEAGLPSCFPELRPPEEKAFRAKGLFDPLLLISDKELVVSNDVELRTGGELLILTGANQGGKTVFLLSMGLGQWLAQLGFPVSAAEAAVSPAENILTIFAPNGQRYGRKGLLAEEAGRIAASVESLTGDSMVLFNEPLTSTGPEETKSISAEVIAVCMAAGARGIWVTHVYELASNRANLEEALPWGSRLGSLRIVLEEVGGETKFTYRVERGEPKGYSHAEDALRRGGIHLSDASASQA
jgi:DNA mismatch repair ATPase MutS